MYGGNGITSPRIFNFGTSVSGHFYFLTLSVAGKESAEPTERERGRAILAFGKNINVVLAGSVSSIPRKSRP